MEDLITEEKMVVSISHNGYIKRTPSSVYRAQRRGGKGIAGAKTEEEDPIAHLFVASTHDYLLFFTNRGKVYWQKVYDLPQLSRESRGRAVVNLLNFAPGRDGSPIAARSAISRPTIILMMATRNGLVKKTPLAAYGRPMKGGIIAIKLKDEDELVDVVITKPGDEVVLSTASGMAIRFARVRCPADGPQHQRRQGHQAGGRRSAGRHGRRRSGGDVAHRLRQRLRQANAVRAEQPGRRWPLAPAARPAKAMSDEVEIEEPTPVEEEEEAKRRRHVEPAALSHSAPRRQGLARHQDDRAQRPGDRRDAPFATTTNC